MANVVNFPQDVNARSLYFKDKLYSKPNSTLRTITFPDLDIHPGDIFITHTFANVDSTYEESSLDTPVFLCPGGINYHVVSVDEIHTVAGTDGGAVSLDVKVCSGTQAPSAGQSVLASVINLKATANTLQSAGLNSTPANLDISGEERLCVVFSGTQTSLQGGCVTIRLRPGQAS